MDEQHVTNAMVWAERSGAFAYPQLQEFHGLIRLLQGSSIMSSDVQGKQALDQGSFGVIEIASFHGAPVAVKNLSHTQLQSKPLPQLFRELFLELQILARVRHPSVVTFMGAAVQFPTQDSPEQSRWRVGLVFELCGGGNLFNRIHEGKQKYTGRQKITIAKEIAMGLSYLHSLNIIHRDLSSRNILLTDDKLHAKIADFGCARQIVGDRYNSTTISGSPCWMSPEQLAGGALTLRADVWSYGIMLWELAKEQLPHGHGAPDLGKMRDFIFQTVLDVPSRECLQGCSRHVCDAFCRLIAVLLQAQAALRPSATEALMAMQELEKNAALSDDAAPRYRVLEKLEKFRETGAKLVSFYDANNPGKIDDLPRVLQLYHNEIMTGDLSKLNADLRKRYNADLNGRYDPPPPEPTSEEEAEAVAPAPPARKKNDDPASDFPGQDIEQPNIRPTKAPEQTDTSRAEAVPQFPPPAPTLLSEPTAPSKQEAAKPQAPPRSRAANLAKDAEPASVDSSELKGSDNLLAGPAQSEKQQSSKMSMVQAMIKALEVSDDEPQPKGGKQSKGRAVTEEPPSGGTAIPDVSGLQQFPEESKDESSSAGMAKPVNGKSSAELEEQLQHFYSVFNPEYLIKCQAVANHYLGKEEDLNKNLRDRYGADLNTFQAQLNQLNRLGGNTQPSAAFPGDMHPHGYVPYATPNLGPNMTPGAMGAQGQGLGQVPLPSMPAPGPMDYSYPGANAPQDQSMFGGVMSANDGFGAQDMSMNRYGVHHTHQSLVWRQHHLSSPGAPHDLPFTHDHFPESGLRELVLTMPEE